MRQIPAFENAKFSRISHIYEQLLQASAAGEALTSSQISRICNVSVKTIQRDLQSSLWAMGARKSGRGWAIDKNKAVDNLKSDERLVLNILDEVSKGIGELFYLKAHNLLAQLTHQLDNPIFTP